jgi:hypothetical protein
MIPYNIEIFSAALGLEAPWFIEDVKFVSVNNSPFKELHININFHKSHSFTRSPNVLKSPSSYNADS